MSIPCENCLVLSICKNQAIDLSDDLPHWGLMPLLMKCDKFKEYCLAMKCVKLGPIGYVFDPYHKEYANIFQFFVKGREHLLSHFQKTMFRLGG